MFKVLKLNTKFQFDLNGDYLYEGSLIKNDEIDNFLISDGTESFSVSRKWLGLICHYEVNLGLKQLMKINFVNCKSKILKFRCESLMVFNSKIPVLDGENVKHGFDGYFIIPGFTNFAINARGDVKSIAYSRDLKKAIGPYGYPYVNLYDADKQSWRSVSIHILLARVFIKNKQPDVRFFVNHKDGDKLNYSLDNLEWVTSLENQNHAVKTSLRRDNIPCKMLDIETKEIKYFDSIADAFRLINNGSKFKRFIIKKDGYFVPRLFKNRYEIRRCDDPTNWYYDGTFGGESFYQDFKNFVQTLKLKDSFDIKPKAFNLVNVKTGEKKYFSSKRQVCKFLDIDKRTLANRLNKKSNYLDWSIELVQS